MTGYSYKTTAIALQGRRLVTAGVRAGAWQAKLTDAGRHYLEHGCHPPGLWREPPSRDRRAAGPTLARFTTAPPPAARAPWLARQRRPGFDQQMSAGQRAFP